MVESLSKEEVDRIFEKQARHELTLEEKGEKEHEERLKARWMIDRSRPRQFPNDAVAKEKRWVDERKGDAASAKQEARSIQDFVDRRRRDEVRSVIKEGVLADLIKIHETDNGFETDTPRNEVEQYLSQHPKFKSKLAIPEELEQGWVLDRAVPESEKERVSYVRKAMVEEFQAKSASDFMLVDFAVSNYFRAMYATMMEMSSLRYADDYRIEMFEVMREGIQPYIHSCQNQFLRVLTALRAGRQSSSRSTFTHETYSRTDINLENWGLPLLLALAEITASKQQEIGIDEIKLSMTRFVKGLDVESIPNSLIGYALGRFGFTEKVHESDGQRYNIERNRVLTLLNEDLKA